VGAQPVENCAMTNGNHRHTDAKCKSGESVLMGRSRDGRMTARTRQGGRQGVQGSGKGLAHPSLMLTVRVARRAEAQNRASEE